MLRAERGDVRIREVRASDLDLDLALPGDAGTMRHLGDPQPDDRIAASHAREVAEVAAGRAWIVVAEVRTEDGWQPAGNVSLVRHPSAEGPTSELGWMVLPAGAAGTWGAVEAFPSTANVASGRMCAGLGFADLGEVELEFAGQRFTCTRWRLEPPYVR